MSQCTLILVRHSDPEYFALSDHSRPLTDLGLRRAHALGIKLQAEVGDIELGVSSTAVRAWQTFDEIAKNLPMRTTYKDRSIYDAGAESLIETINSLPGESALIVGHQPTIGHVGYLIGDDSAKADLGTGVGKATALIIQSEGSFADFRPGANLPVRIVTVPRVL